MELREEMRIKLVELEGEKEREIQLLLHQIAQMETSKFWKMRNAYLDSKTAVLRLAENLLPRRAG